MTASELTYYKHVKYRNVVDGSSMIGFPIVIADPDREMPGIELGPLADLQLILTFLGTCTAVNFLYYKSTQLSTYFISKQIK